DCMSFLHLSFRQIQDLDCIYGVNVPLILMNPFHTDCGTANIIEVRASQRLHHMIITFNGRRYPRVANYSLLPVPRSYNSAIGDW
ncbi:hypothetical protein FN846DRAFT_773506, partial [Sphaerosporella brunnea]